MPDPFLAIFSHTPTCRSTFASSHASNSAASRNAITSASSTAGFPGTPRSSGRTGWLLGSSALAQDVEVVPVEHDAQDVAERVNDRGGHEPRALLGDRLELLGAQRHQPVERGRHVIDMPVDDHPAWSGRQLGRGEPPLDDAELVLVVADPELDVTRPAPGGLAGEVRLDTQQLGIPARSRSRVL